MTWLNSKSLMTMTRDTRKHATLKAWRRALELNQRDASKRLKLSQSHYSKLERGTHITTGPRARGISEKTGVPVAVLVGAV